MKVECEMSPGNEGNASFEKRPRKLVACTIIFGVRLLLLPILSGPFILQSTPAQAQELLLDENCTISILNRTAQVQPDGSWRIDNVPANFGAVRARATCVEGGVTLSGQSGLFDVEEGIVNGFDAEIVLGSATPIPVSLAMSSPVSTLTSAGATAQLSVTATFPDGGTSEVSAAANGTNYTVSNPAVATADIKRGQFTISAAKL